MILISFLGLALSPLAHADMREIYEEELAASQDMSRPAGARDAHRVLAEIYLEQLKENEASLLKPVVSRVNNKDCLDPNFSGSCDYTYKSGERYVGQWVNGKFDGYGTLTQPNGYRYEGGWRNDQKQGRGVEVLADGARYEGNFEEGKPQGRGAYIQSDGMRYEGDWRDGKMHGRGTIKYADGGHYEGGMVNGRENGYGTHTNPNGDRYQGEFVNGTLNGSATITLANGERHKGNCHNEKCEIEDERPNRQNSYQRYDSGYSSPPIQLPSRSNDDFVLPGYH